MFIDYGRQNYKFVTGHIKALHMKISILENVAKHPFNRVYCVPWTHFSVVASMVGTMFP